MFSGNALVPAWIFLILFVNLTEGDVNLSDLPATVPPTHYEANTPSFDNTQSVETNTRAQIYNTTKTFSESVTKFETNTRAQVDSTPGTQSANYTEAPPAHIVKSSTGQPCLLATFNMTIRVSYYVMAAKSKNKYIAFKDLALPDGDDSSKSICGDNSSSLVLDWGNSTFNLNLTFNSHGKSKEGVHTNWTLDSIAVGYNLSNFIAFPGASQDDYISVEKKGLGLFNTAIGHTKECDQVTKLILGKEETATVIKLEYIKLAAFNLSSEAFPKETEECILKSSSIRDEDIMVPLIIACALSFVIIVVVVAYAISRKVQEARDQSQYKPMP